MNTKIIVVIWVVSALIFGFAVWKTIEKFSDSSEKFTYTKILENNEYKIVGFCDVTRRLSNDTDLYVELIPNTHVKCPRDDKTIFIDINSLGFRDAEFQLNKPKDTKRILAMGDSFTYGWYVNLSDAWPKKLQVLLNQDDDYEILNLGIPGYDIWNVANLFSKTAYEYNPDILLISFIRNDIAPEAKVCYNECLNISENTTQCSMTCKQSIVTDFANNDTHIFEYVDKSFNLIRSKYDGIIFLIKFSLGDDSYEEIIKNLADEYNIRICEMVEVYQLPVEELTLSETDLHPNEFAYSLIAQDIYNCLKS